MISKLRNLYKALAMGRKDAFYAVRTGRETGVYRTWRECERLVKDFPGARYKKFPTEKEAWNFVSGTTSSSTLTVPKKRSLDEISAYDCCGSSANPRKLKYHKSFHSASSNGVDSVTSPSPKSTSDSDSSSSQPVVYTDGCCTKNGRNGARAGIGVYWGLGNKWNVSERLQGEQTNQRAEIMAAVKAIETAKALGYKSLEIKTDSRYTINGATDWSVRWKKNGWKTINGTEVKNKAEFQKLVTLCDEINVKWTHVPGHQGIPGNEAADTLAKEGSEK